jgi:anti-anti-sigma factor
MTGTKLSIDAESVDGVARVRLDGELDISAVESVEAVTRQWLASPGCRRLCLDLADLTFCDSSGLGMLVHLRKVCADQGVDLVLERPHERVRRVITLTGLDGIFRIES